MVGLPPRGGPPRFFHTPQALVVVDSRQRAGRRAIVTQGGGIPAPKIAPVNPALAAMANVTGAQMLTGLSQKRLQLLKQAFPDAEHIAVLANPKDEISVSEMPKAEMAAAQMGVHLIPFVASAPAELRALEPSALSHSDGLLVMPGGMFWNNRATIIGIAAMARVPAIYPEREYADDGGLIAYGPNPVVHFPLQHVPTGVNRDSQDAPEEGSLTH